MVIINYIVNNHLDFQSSHKTGNLPSTTATISGSRYFGINCAKIFEVCEATSEGFKITLFPPAIAPFDYLLALPTRYFLSIPKC